MCAQKRERKTERWCYVCGRVCKGEMGGEGRERETETERDREKAGGEGQSRQAF